MRNEPAPVRRTGGPGTGRIAAGIIPAKIRAPRVRWLARERLDQLVPRLWQHRLTLVVAPAGSGKTPLEPMVSDATGAFSAQVLTLPRDRVGARTLRAIAAVPGLDVDPVGARFLVLASTAAPPVSGLVQVFSATPGDPIILRR